MPDNPNGLSVILPTFNLEARIDHTIAALRTELLPIAPALEFIVVDDGSTDSTVDTVRTLLRRNNDVRLLRNRQNFGKGMAVYLGLLASRHRVVCFTDADLSFAPGNYALVSQRLLSGRPMVIASRRLAHSQILIRLDVLGYAARRHLIGLTFNRLVRLSLGLPFRDTQCGLKGFDRHIGIELFAHVHDPRFLFDIELLLAAQAAKIDVDEVPVCVRYEDFKSSVRLAPDSTRMLYGLLMIWARYRMGRYRRPTPAMAPEAVHDWTEELLP